MNLKTHWDTIYGKKAPDAVSWYRPHLETSLELIERVAAGRSASIIDVGGGESTLVDDLLAEGYSDLSVLDISQVAVDKTKERLGLSSDGVRWLVGDVTTVKLEASAYDVWHDRAVFHFLASDEERMAYVAQVASAVRSGGHVIVSTFGPEGPTQCSGLDVVRTLGRGDLLSESLSEFRCDDRLDFLGADRGLLFALLIIRSLTDHTDRRPIAVVVVVVVIFIRVVGEV